MNTFFSRWFGDSRTTPAPHSQAAGSDNRDNPLTIEEGSENATRRQLIQVLLRDVLRKSGIPPQWVECQMLLVSSRTRGHGMYVRLVVKHWDARFLNYAYAFQQTLLTDIERFEPRASEWLHGISWQLEVADSCPYTVLPDKAFWQEPPHKTAGPPASAPVSAGPAPGPRAQRFEPTAPDPEDDPAQDLERLFAIRDRELDQRASEGLTPVGYEKTQPSPL